MFGQNYIEMTNFFFQNCSNGLTIQKGPKWPNLSSLLSNQNYFKPNIVQMTNSAQRMEFCQNDKIPPKEWPKNINLVKVGKF